MVNDPKPKSMPKGSEIFSVTKASAARAQLETAIWLWFNNGDPVSIHTLAVAAHDCFSALLSHATRDASAFRSWMKSQSKERQKRATLAQNFFKHGSKKLKGVILLPTIDAEVLMMDAVTCYDIISKKPRALMRLYAWRFVYEHPDLMAEAALPAFSKNAEVHNLVDSTREQFFEKVFPIFARQYHPGAAAGRFHLP